MSDNLTILLLSATSIGFFHTILGPDHYLPFIVMSRSGRWSINKTVIFTILCGFGHVLSSIFLGIASVYLGLAAERLELIESIRGSLAGWGLIVFGLIYLSWGIKKILRNKPHQHDHIHINGQLHTHPHKHSGNHFHIHDKKSDPGISPLVLFLIFVLGPCEPLIPLIMYPALNNDTFGTVMVALVFTLITIVTMVGIVLISLSGIKITPLNKFKKYTHAVAGITVFLCGVAIQFWGL